MKPEKIKRKPIKTVPVLLLFALLISGCGPSYDDISFKNFTGDSAGLKDFQKENYGYIVYDIQDEKIVKGHNIGKEFTPASVTKLFTALFTAETLGFDYHFTTTISYDGKISDNILTGNIYLTGSGDPELSISELITLVNGIKEKKIKEVKGNFYFDESLFTPREKLDPDMPDDSYYNAGLSPLSLNSNNIYALKKTDSKGKVASVNLLPSLPDFNAYVYNEDLPYPYFKYKFSGGKETWGFPAKNLWDNRQQLPVKHPGLYTAQTLRKLCEIHGIKLPLPKSGKTPSSSENIFELKSRNLALIIKNMLYTSNNLTAEILYAICSGLYENRNKDKNAMEEFYKKNFTGINWDNFRIENASGLTTLNKATPEQTAAVLLFLDKLNEKNFTLEEILPVSGWEGTMRNRLDQPESAFRVYAKTGSIFYASSLAGTFYGKSGKKYIFTIYINDFDKRSEYDRKIGKTVDDLNKGGIWTKQSSSAIDDFILKMIDQL